MNFSTHVSKSLLHFSFVLIANGLPSAAFAQTSSTPVVTNIVAFIGNGVSDGNAVIIVATSNPDDSKQSDQIIPTNIEDIGTPTPPSVHFQKVSELSRSASQRNWLIEFKVQGMPADTSQQRYVRFASGGLEHTYPFTLTNIPDPVFKWTLHAPPVMAIDHRDAIPIGISVGAVPATAIHLVYASIIEKSRKVTIAATSLQLCKFAEGDCPLDEKGIQIGARQSQELWLRGDLRPGQYEGNILIATPEKPEGDSIPVSVSVSSPLARFWGVVAIFFGVVFGWLATVFARNLLNRYQLLLPAAELRERLAAAQSIVDTALNADTGRPKVPSLITKIEQLTRDLENIRLESRGLPARIPAPWAPLPTTGGLDTYLRYLQEKADWVLAIEIVINSGLSFAWSKWNAQDPAAQTAVTDAVAGMMTLLYGATPLPAAELNQRLDLLRKRLVDSIQPGPASASALPPTSEARSTAELRVQITRVGELAWAFVTVATTLVGSYILIFQSSATGFGSPADYMTCLLWGFGFSAGSQLLNSTPASIATSFGIVR